MNKLLKVLIVTAALLFAVSIAQATTMDIDTSDDGLTVTLTIIDGDDNWTWTDTFTASKYSTGVRVNYIRFHPGATDDICIIGDSDDADVYHFYAKCADTYDDRIQYYSGSKLKLLLTIATGTYVAEGIITIQLWPTQEP